jgi:predicted ArsR family transcriptional regulator
MSQPSEPLIRRVMKLDEKDKKILAALSILGDTPRFYIVHQTGIPRTTVYDRLERLEEMGCVWRHDQQNQVRRGRPIVYWRLTEIGKHTLREARKDYWRQR